MLQPEEEHAKSAPDSMAVREQEQQQPGHEERGEERDEEDERPEHDRDDVFRERNRELCQTPRRRGRREPRRGFRDVGRQRDQSRRQCHAGQEDRALV